VAVAAQTIAIALAVSTRGNNFVENIFSSMTSSLNALGQIANHARTRTQVVT
jgi:hypothetical protein